MTSSDLHQVVDADMVSIDFFLKNVYGEHKLFFMADDIPAFGDISVYRKQSG